MIRNTGILFLVVIVAGLLFYLLSNQNYVKYSWCENCEQIRVESIRCIGLKIGNKSIIKSCRNFPI